MKIRKNKSLKEITNIQEQLRLLQLQKKAAETESRAKSEFIINIIHDIRSPLAGITELTSHLAEKIDSPKEKEYAKVVYEGSKQLLDLLNVVMDPKKSFKQDSNVMRKAFHLTEVIEKIKELEKPSIIEKDLKLEIDVDEMVPTQLIGDRLKLERILLNLVSNAVKFTVKGSIKIKLRLLSKIKNEVQIEFSVSDTGIGIPPNEQYKVFKRYYKVNSGITNYSSNGLGLDIVHKYVRLLGGQISLKSSIDEGTTFSFVLPMKVNYQSSKVTARALPLHKKMINGNSLDKKLKILLVEDNHVVLTSIKLMMDTLGIAPTTAVNNQTAISAIHEQIFDIVITDIELPDGSGYSLSEKIRSLEKQQGIPPVTIIGVTGHAVGEITKRGKEAGMNDVYQKPLNLKRLATLVARVMQDKTEFERTVR